MDVTVAIYDISTNWPDSERFGLTSQVRRAAVSMPSNIAEGHAREGSKDFHRFLGYSRGSVAEVETQLELACRLKFTSRELMQPILESCAEVARMTAGLRRSLERKMD